MDRTAHIRLNAPPKQTRLEETDMPAYWVARSKINDPVEYKKYTDLVPAIIAKHGGKVLARGGKFQIMEGPDKFSRFIVIEFPTFEQGVACFTSPEYDQGRGVPAQRGGRGGDHHGGGDIAHLSIQRPSSAKWPKTLKMPTKQGFKREDPYASSP